MVQSDIVYTAYCNFIDWLSESAGHAIASAAATNSDRYAYNNSHTYALTAS